MDNLLGSIKDIAVIKKCLAAINQTTDDFLFAFDIPGEQVEFFGPINEFFELGDTEKNKGSFEDFLKIVHPADRKILCADVEKIRMGAQGTHDMDLRVINRRGETIWVNSRGKVIHDESGAPYIMIGRMSEEALRHLYNPITGLWNKTKLRGDLKQRLSSGKGWLIFLGIASFSDINLSHGREFGNQLLCDLAAVLEDVDGVEESYHIDNNNFAIVLRECPSDAVEDIYGQVCRAMSGKCSVFAGAAPIDNSIFIDVSQIIDSANITLREAAKSPSGQIVFFSAEDINNKIRELTLLEELKESVQNGFAGFEVQYQPQIKSGSYEIYGVEALLRYHSGVRGRVFPDEFIPVIERSGLIVPVGEWVLHTALEQCKEWRKSIPDLQVAVNFSSVQFEDPRLGEKIVAALKKAGLPGSALTVELTESLQLSENKIYYDVIKYIRSYGVRFSIDGFGTGYSNLGYLKQLDVNEIKIDRSFVSEIEKNTYNYRLICNVIEFAKTNSIHACCEGVETAKELSVLEPLQADIFQGYLFDKPCTVDELEQKYIHPHTDKYKARLSAIEEIQRFKEQFGSIHFDPKNILGENDIGLWILRTDEKNGHRELHTDSIMERVLGVTKKLSPEECYEYWYDRIVPKHRKYVDDAIALMIDSPKAVQMEYYWQHPTFGEVLVRSSGIRTRGEGARVMIEGYHRILTGVEGV